jgi:hypothetical protein
MSLLAFSGHSEITDQCPLSGVKRTSIRQACAQPFYFLYSVSPNATGRHDLYD